MRRVVGLSRLQRRLAITFALVAAVSTGVLALGTYLVVREARLDDAVDSSVEQARANLLLAGAVLRQPLAQGESADLLAFYAGRSGFETGAITEGEWFSSNLSLARAHVPAGVAETRPAGRPRVRASPDRGHAVPRRRWKASRVGNRALLLLLRREPARGPRAAPDDPPRRVGRRGRSRGSSRCARRPPGPPPGRAGERSGSRARRGAPRDPAPGRDRRRARRLGGVVQRDGRGARGEDPRPLGGSGARAPLHRRCRARAAHAPDRARRRSRAARRAPRAHARRRRGGRQSCSSRTSAGCAAWSRS